MRLILLFLFLSVPCFAKEKEVFLDFRDYALKLCLTINYKELGIELNDASKLSENHSVQEIYDLMNFVTQKMNEFHKQKYIIHMEERKDIIANDIFLQCISFYKSKELSDFVESLEK
ncbi:hypothetical protein [Avibacterium sp. 21-599]|uniref:hypothetical protein n=1 Tax=Avibacterium sp. 21-599 TaxID=2911528 RepID=UPI002246C215|nr:hypothetical protein [Avibacterium sp. 21-599]MCW9718673.1 hypothetical protein [Avibacterium sp. 21-599]MCW9719134.1 hypothetical protein [Avibacterium sp. 21-599]